MENKIVIESPQHCLEVINALIDNSYPKENAKYAKHVSMSYFTLNLNQFDNKDVERILKEDSFNLAVASKIIYQMLDQAIQNNQIFTRYAKSWFRNVKDNQPLLVKYLDILLHSEDDQQIEDFCNANPDLSRKYFKEKTIANDTFRKNVIGNNPQLIKQGHYLSQEDMLDFIDKNLINYQHIKNNFHTYSYKVQVASSKAEVKQILNFDLKENNYVKKFEIMELIRENPVFFLNKIKEINPEFTKELLSSSGLQYSTNHPRNVINFLQTIIEMEARKPEDIYSDVKGLLVLALHDYHEIYFSDVKKLMGEMKYEYKQDYLLYLYENREYGSIKGLCYFQDELTPERKEIVLCAVFENLLTQKVNKKDEEFNMYHEIKPLLTFSYNELIKKLENLKSSPDKHVKLDIKFMSEIDDFLLNNKLNEKLIPTNIKDKKLKI